MSDDGTGREFDEDEFLAAWHEADRQAAEVLREECREVLAEPAPEPDLERAVSALREGLASRRPPFDYFRRGCGWDDATPRDPLTLWLEAAAATVSPPNDPGTDAEEQAAVFALEHGDWLDLVTGLVRRGPGVPFDPETVERDIEERREREGDGEPPEGEFGIVALAVAVLTPLWEALGILDERERLTAVGRWGLPRAVLAAWQHDRP